MAPNDTNTSRQARRHAVPLIGIAAAVVFAFGSFLWWYWSLTDKADEPAEPASAEAPVADQ